MKVKLVLEIENDDMDDGDEFMDSVTQLAVDAIDAYHYVMTVHAEVLDDEILDEEAETEEEEEEDEEEDEILNSDDSNAPAVIGFDPLEVLPEPEESDCPRECYDPVVTEPTMNADSLSATDPQVSTGIDISIS